MELKALNYILKPGNDDELLMTLDEAFDIADGFSKQNDDSLINTLDNASVKTSAVANKVSDYIEEHYTENISLREVADAMGYSDAYFCKIFKQCFEMSFISYLNGYRTKKAIDLLGDVTVSIKDISAMSGYRDANYFTRIFKKTTGVTPSEYRERVIKGDINYVI
jgi:YesN/AraC family two-component response regulator